MACRARGVRDTQIAIDQRLDAELADSFPASDVPSILRSYRTDTEVKRKAKCPPSSKAKPKPGTST